MFNTELPPERYWYGPRSEGVREGVCVYVGGGGGGVVGGGGGGGGLVCVCARAPRAYSSSSL